MAQLLNERNQVGQYIALALVGDSCENEHMKENICLM